jgi:cytosine deaminase
MMTDKEINNGLDFITINGAKTLSVEKDYKLKKGGRASFIVLDAPDERTAIRERAHVILSVNKGKIIVRKTPEKLTVVPWSA